jgi:hypothetical protein
MMWPGQKAQIVNLSVKRAEWRGGQHHARLVLQLGEVEAGA